MYTPKET